MTDTMTSRNIDLSSWETLYILIFKFLDSNQEDKIFCTEW